MCVSPSKLATGTLTGNGLPVQGAAWVPTAGTARRRFGRIQLREQNAVQLVEDPGLLPSFQAPPARLSRAEPQLQSQQLPD